MLCVVHALFGSVYSHCRRSNLLQAIDQKGMNKGPLLLSHKLNTHVLSSKQDLECDAS